MSWTLAIVELAYLGLTTPRLGSMVVALAAGLVGLSYVVAMAVSLR